MGPRISPPPPPEYKLIRVLAQPQPPNINPWAYAIIKNIYFSVFIFVNQVSSGALRFSLGMITMAF